jgi:hypothetical protein
MVLIFEQPVNHTARTAIVAANWRGCDVRNSSRRQNSPPDWAFDAAGFAGQRRR